MGCPCHGDSRIEVLDVSAYEQCLECLKKHVVIAYCLYNEFNYQDLNLAVIEGNLRLAVNHCMYDLPDVAKEIRALALDISNRDFVKVNNERFEQILNEIQDAIYKKFPEIKEKYENFKASNQK